MGVTTSMRSALGIWAGLWVLLVTAAGWAEEGGPQLRVQPGIAKPGDLVLLTVRGFEEPPAGALGEKELTFHPVPGGFQALTGLSVDLSPRTLEVKVWRPGAQKGAALALEGTLEVVPPGFPERELKVDNKYIHPPAKVRRWMADDKAAFKRAFAQPPGARLFGAAFEWPRAAVFTAHFGDLRTYNGKKQSQHYGLDIDGRTGEPVFAANDGTVVLSRACYASGGTVVLHHGAGLYTTYFHLSKRVARQGAKVKRGELIGLVGATGRVTGPHLHFGVKADGMWVNPESLVPLDFE